MAETTNYGLYVTDDSTTPFITWREKMNSQTNSNMTKIDTALKGIAGTTYSTTLLSTVWSNGVYSFESSYPFATYDIFLEPNGDSITDAQLDAWCNAKILGSMTTNTYIAKGEVPTVNIPVVLRVVKK